MFVCNTVGRGPFVCLHRGEAPFLVCNKAGRGPFVCLHHGGAGPLILPATRRGGPPLVVCNKAGLGPFVCLHHGGAGPLFLSDTRQDRALLFNSDPGTRREDDQSYSMEPLAPTVVRVISINIYFISFHFLFWNVTIS